MAVQLDDFAAPADLPSYLTRFAGRDSELAELRRILGLPDVRLVTVIGPGGVGKTRLVIEALSSFELPQYAPLIFLDCAPLNAPEDVLPALALRFGIEQVGDQSGGEQLSELLADRSAVAVLDNMEHLTAASLQIGALLRACPGLRVVVTSRTPLRLSHERLFPIEPLPTIASAGARWSPAAVLLLDRAALAGAAFPGGEPDPHAIDAICARLDGLPLAIELAAPRLRLLSPEALLALLTRQLTLLASGPVDASPRHQTLRAAIAWSYALLPGEAQRVMRLLGVFPESFSLEMVGQLCFPELPEATRSAVALDWLTDLFDQGLLQRASLEHGERVRFRMLTSIREFADEQLTETGELADARKRLAELVDRLVAELSPELIGPQQADVMHALAAESANLRAAFDWAIEEGQTELGLRLIAGLWRFWANRGLLHDARSIIDRFLARSTGEPTAEWGAALRGAAVIAELQTDWDAARTWGEGAIAIWEALDDPGQLARSWVDLGNVSSSTGALDRARDAYDRAYAYAAVAGDLRMETVARCSTGNVALRQGLPSDAAMQFEIAIPIMRQLGDQWLLAMTLANYAIALCRMGQPGRAIPCLNECLVIRRELGDESGRAMALLTLEEAMGEEALGGPYAREALEIAQRIGAPDLVGPASVNIGIHALREGNQRLAAEYLGAALKEFASAENPISVSETIELIAELAERSDPASAARLLGGAAAYRADHAVSWQGQHAPRTKALDRRLEHSLGPAAYAASRQSGVELELRELAIEALLLAQAYGHPEDAPFDRETLTPALTSREQVVLRLMVDGKSDREIGAELFISPKTANRHVTSILAKLGCRNRTAAATKAHQLGLV